MHGIYLVYRNDTDKPKLWKLLTRALAACVIAVFPAWKPLLMIVGSQPLCLRDLLMGSRVQPVA